MYTDPKKFKVLIVSCTSFVSDFLRGLVEAHGYETKEVSDFQEAQLQVNTDRPHVVFIDDSCLEMGNTMNFELSTRNLAEEGIPIILLANEHTKQQIERPLLGMKFLQIVEKPVGYLQIGQIIADLGNT